MQDPNSVPPLNVAPRQADHEIDDVILNRWCSRAMTGDSVPELLLFKLFEAARWAPSSFNNQGWRFLYTQRERNDWPDFLNLLTEWNRSWCERAGALIIVLSMKTFSHDGTPNPTHSLDTGMAVQNLLLQATHLGVVVHPLAGFDHELARETLKIPDDVHIECMIAVGIAGKHELLPSKLLAREVRSRRKPISEIVRSGKYTF
ncbi:MAG TPA: nitroreductase family protein [Planctomicrobium sp.]|nr:nitroreductase family protein [Planctomicrobium sp.]